MMHSSEDGFTLVEVLVATFIMALLAVMGTGLLTSVMSNRDRVESVGADTRDLELMRAVLKRDLSQVVPRRARDSFGVEARAVFEAGERFNEGRLMAFITNGREMIGPRENNSRLEYVEILVKDGALIRRGWGFADLSPDSVPTDRVLLDGISNVDVSFLTPRGWVDAVASGTTVTSAIPVAAQIDFTHESFGPLEVRFLINGGP